MARSTSDDARPRMEATLIRFGAELLAATKIAARRDGVSVAQYVREAVVERLARTAAHDNGDVESPVDRAARLQSERSAVLEEGKLARAQAERHRAEARATRESYHRGRSSRESA